MQTSNIAAKNFHSARANSRWKWMAGATAATAAAATGAHAEIVQIDLINNHIGTGSNTLNADLTGTGLSITGLVDHSGGGFHTKYREGYSAKLTFEAPERGVANNTIIAQAINGTIHPSGTSSKRLYQVAISNKGKSAKNVGSYQGSSGSVHVALLVPIELTSSNVNGGTPTDALLELQADSVFSAYDVSLTRLVYDKGDPTIGTATLQGEVTAGDSKPVIGSTANGVFTPEEVPEPSTLSLLALGAGGVLLRRLRQKTLKAA